MVYFSLTLGQLDLKQLNARLQQNCTWMENQDIALKEEIDKAYILELLELRIKDLDISAAKRDVDIFIADTSVLDFWSQDFFMEIIHQIQVKL